MGEFMINVKVWSTPRLQFRWGPCEITFVSMHCADISVNLGLFGLLFCSKSLEAS